MSPAELVFPVLTIDGFGLPCGRPSLLTLQRCHARALKRGLYRGLRVFDVAGDGLVVRDAHRVRTLWRLVDFEILLFNPPVEVRLEIDAELHGLTLEHVKQELCDMVDKDESDLWDPRAGEKAAIRQLRTIEEAIRRYMPLDGYPFGGVKTVPSPRHANE